MDMNNKEILKYHKHRFPYLLIDNIDEIEAGKRAHGYKYFSENEWIFHCNENTNQPAPLSIIVEVLIEMFLMPVLILEESKGKITNCFAIDEVEIVRQVYPGDCLAIEANINSWKRGIASGVVKGYIDDELACSAKLKFVVPDVMEQFKPAKNFDNQ